MWGGRRSDLDQRDEVQAHIRIEADRLRAEGLSEAEALRAARASFGYSEHLDPVAPRRSTWTTDLFGDVRVSVRRLAAAPATTVIILLSLVIGIGVNTAIFSLSDQALLRSLPVSNPDELVQLEWDGQWIGEGRGYGNLLPHPLYQDLRAEQSVFTDVIARSPGEVTLVTSDGPERAQVELVTGGYFSTLGVRAALGRLFTEADDVLPGGHPVVVLSHAYWQSRFGASSDVLGRQIRLNGSPVTVVGVAEQGFHGTDWSIVPAVWLPMMMNGLVHDWGGLDDRRVRFQHVFARLAPGVSIAQAQAAVDPWFSSYIRADVQRAGWPTGIEPPRLDRYLASRLSLEPGSQGEAAFGDRLQQPMLILTAATALLLLLACLNVANLSLAKAVARQRDTAVRTALGASRRRLIMERLVESAVLAVVGGAIGVALAPAIGRWILGYLQITGSADMALDPALDARALVSALVIATVATVLSGAGPAWFAASARPSSALKAGGRGTTGGLGARKLLVVGQVSLALVFLISAGLFSGTLRTLKERGPGFQTDELLVFTLSATNDGFDIDRSKAMLREISDRLVALPEVRAAGIGRWPVLQGGGWNNPVTVETTRRFGTDASLPMNAVTPGFFSTLGVPFTMGRDFDSRDVREEGGWGFTSAIVSQSFVDQYLPGENPIGARIAIGTNDDVVPTIEIVGVVQGYHEHGLREAAPQVFFSLWERTAAAGTFYVRARGSMESMSGAIRSVVREVEADLTVNELRTIDDQIDRLLVSERMLATLAGAFALFGTILAMIGVYGVLSFSAECRRKEVGIRLALGAPQRAAGGLIVGEALGLAALGVVIALPVTWLVGRLVESQLYGVAGVDPVVTGGAVALLLTVCLGSSALPAWRLRSVDPLEALRVE